MNEACQDMACVGGVPGQCEKEEAGERAGKGVFCAAAGQEAAAKDEPTAQTSSQEEAASKDEPSSTEQTSSQESAASEEGSSAEAPKSKDVHKKVADVGDFGGWCECPSGQRYNVGSRDGCATGLVSLACVGGMPIKCNNESDPSRSGMQVTCAGPPEENIYRSIEGVGGWSGTCTCPDGQQYHVGDMNEACQDMACVGGVPGQCEKEEAGERAGKGVFCAAAGQEAAAKDEPTAQTSSQEEAASKDEPSSTEQTSSREAAVPEEGSSAEAPKSKDIYKKVADVGDFGGWCECPSGQRYNVGSRDGCATGLASLACVGGMPIKCNNESDPSRSGMQVTCARPPEENIYRSIEGVGGWGG